MTHLFPYNFLSKFLFVLVLIYLPFIVFSQEKKDNEQILDSLTNQYNTVIEDSSKLRIVNEILLQSNSEKALEYYGKGYKISQKYKDKQHILILNMAGHYLKTGKINSSIPYYEKVISEIDSNQISQTILKITRLLA